MKETQKAERQYFIDWLRIGLIISVYLFHIGMIFRPEHWHVNSIKSEPWLDPIMGWLHLWRMPLLFLVSGVGTYYALGFRTVKEYLKERIVRLFIPFFVGIFTLVPIQVYIEKIANYSSLLDFYQHMFEGIYPVGNFSWHHLWFLIYLLLISFLISPFLNFLRSVNFQKTKNWMINKVSVKLGLNWLLPILIISQWFLRQFFPDSTKALFNDWAYISFYLIFFLAGFILFTSPKMIHALSQQRRLYLSQTILFSIANFARKFIELPSEFGYLAYLICSVGIAWSCGMAAIGYAKTYLNQDNRFRKHLNTGIYPFYLLHQPVLVIVGYFILPLGFTNLLSATLILFASFVIIIVLYWFVIKPFNLIRIIFGLKPQDYGKKVKSSSSQFHTS